MVEEFNLKGAKVFLKKYWVILVLLAIILFGAQLRVYHIDYPVIGYHNWKEVHYLTEARNFAEEGFFKHGFFLPYRDFFPATQLSDGVHGDTFPTISILAGIGFKIFGEKLLVARMIGFLLSTLSIILVYLVAYRISKNNFFSITAAFLTALNPMFVFYSHNVQLMNVGLFFGLGGLYFMLRWVESDKQSALILGCIGFALAALTKYPFLIMTSGLLFLLPYKKKLRTLKKDYKKYIIPVLILLLVPMWMIYAKIAIADYGLTSTAVDIGNIQAGKLFTGQFYQIAKAYTRDNFTLLGITYAFLGLIALLALGKRKSMLTKYFYGALIGILIFMPIMAEKVSGHSYHYFPIALTIILLMSYFFMMIASLVKTLVEQASKNKILLNSVQIIVIVLLVLTLYQGSIEAKNRQFDTQFPGLDIAGSYIASFAEPNDRIIHSSHQAYGVLWHGEVSGTRGIPIDLKDIKYAEEELDVEWIFMYNWDFGKLSTPDVGQHIRDNYHLAQLGFQQNQQQAIPIYFIFRKGGNFTEQDINDMLANNPVQQTEYEYTYGRVPFYFVSE